MTHLPTCLTTHAIVWLLATGPSYSQPTVELDIGTMAYVPPHATLGERSLPGIDYSGELEQQVGTGTSYTSYGVEHPGFLPPMNDFLKGAGLGSADVSPNSPPDKLLDRQLASLAIQRLNIGHQPYCLPSKQETAFTEANGSSLYYQVGASLRDGKVRFGHEWFGRKALKQYNLGRHDTVRVRSMEKAQFSVSDSMKFCDVLSEQTYSVIQENMADLMTTPNGEMQLSQLSVNAPHSTSYTGTVSKESSIDGYQCDRMVNAGNNRNDIVTFDSLDFDASLADLADPSQLKTIIEGTEQELRSYLEKLNNRERTKSGKISKAI
ncbi:hypothetical protein BJ085DRAFT_31982 [Dimargaris cristalligena]|uniref:Uncharacterized protein n=1 Tax=Dimargaris cristalligena TaxID=215637 RepID=A0A4P9ZX30_9FUNG|nr:hypothetical protein BJ085DRAFT_31982 [Dimargaris cristalligena]|eukprot:RKP38193.1 hypothetical protein BJ085DRAFT_31982 [Dimargaris cristalligena]